MRHLFKLFLALFVASFLSSPALTSQSGTSFAATVTQDQAQEKTDLYKKFLDNIKGTPEQQKTAYEAGKEYLQRYSADNDQYVKYIQRWIASYEKIMREFNFTQAFNAKDYAKAFELGREILASDPDNFRVGLMVAQTGLNRVQEGDASVGTDALNLTKHALEVLDAGKVTDFTPFKTKDEARSFLNYVTGALLFKASSLTEAATAFQKVVRTEGLYKNDPLGYFVIAASIAKNEYEPLSKEYNDKFGGKEATPESTAMLEKLNVVVDRIIDAYARAAALSTKPEQQKFKTETVMPQLTEMYKFRHNNSDAGLTDLINTVLSKPMPQ